jgi:predicted dehydrogenase
MTTGGAVDGSQFRAIVVGAGFAGEGHTIALRENGVAVEAICARTPAAVQAMADKLGVPRASTDWRQTLADLKPEIVCVATPAGAHAEVIEAALAQGCHVFSDKPLAPTAPVAGHLYTLARAAGVKHAYAATHRYDPSVEWLEELVRDGVIGQVGEVEGTFRRHIHPLTPWTWYDSVALGGGLLHNALPHWLGILQRVLGGDVQAAVGETRQVRKRAPLVPDIHDFRLRGALRPTPEEAEQLEWRDCDSDSGFTALLRIGTRDADHAAQVSISATGHPAVWPPNGWRFNGTDGTLLADGHFSYTVRLHRAGTPAEQWEDLPIPQRILDAHPHVGDEFQRKWTALARDFVGDLIGQPRGRYLTFRDGWRFQEAFDTIRAGNGWTTLPE